MTIFTSWGKAVTVFGGRRCISPRPMELMRVETAVPIRSAALGKSWSIFVNDRDNCLLWIPSSCFRNDQFVCFTIRTRIRVIGARK